MDRVSIWRRILEVYGLVIEYIHGKNIMVPGELSQLINNGNQNTTPESNYIMEIIALRVI